MLNPLAFYMFMTVWIYLMISYALLELYFYDVRKVIMDDFVCRKGMPFI